MKSVLPIAAGILGVGALIYIYLKQRDKKKKPNSEDNNDGGDIVRDTVETLEFQVENNFVPLIVGRNSVNLKSIEEKTKTIIRFRECGDDHQMCTIKGKVNNVKLAKQLIEVEKTKPSVITDELLVPTSSCGKIEGYCGSVLHEICQKSSAKVWVDPGTRKVNQGEHRRVLITGLREQIELAKKLIEEKIKEPAAEIKSDEKDDEMKRSPRGSLSPFGSSSSITATELPRDIMLPSPEKLKNNEGKLEVFVSAVASPSRFWVQLCGPQSMELEFLVDAMTEYYNQKESQVLHAIREPYLGQIVAAMFLADNKWYRAEVVAIQPNTSNDLVLDVYFLDYGDQQFVGKKDILELRADFLSLRFQAIECFLAHVQPTKTGSKIEEWDRQSIEAFESLVKVAQWKKMISKTVSYKERKSFPMQRSNKRESSPIPGIELFEEENEKNVALELVKLGCAEMSDRFGDLAKSSVLKVRHESSKEEAAIEPQIDEIFEPREVIAAEPKEAIVPVSETVVPVPEVIAAEPEEEEEKARVKKDADDDSEPIASIKEQENAEIKEEEDTPLTKADETPISPNLNETFVKESSPVKEEPPSEPSSNEFSNKLRDEEATKENKNNLDPLIVANGKSPAQSENLFGGNHNNNTNKPLKKKKLTTADFLKNEQQQASSAKGADWNAMMEE